MVSGGTQSVTSFGTAVNDTVELGGNAYFTTGGLMSGGFVASGGTVFVSEGGQTSNVTVSGGEVNVGSGGTVFHNNVVGVTDDQNINSSAASTAAARSPMAASRISIAAARRSA